MELSKLAAKMKKPLLMTHLEKIVEVIKEATRPGHFRLAAGP